MSKGKRSVTVSDCGDRVRARVCAGDIEIGVGFLDWDIARFSVAKAKRFHAGLGAVIEAAEVQAKKGARS